MHNTTIMVMFLKMFLVFLYLSFQLARCPSTLASLWSAMGLKKSIPSFHKNMKVLNMCLLSYLGYYEGKLNSYISLFSILIGFRTSISDYSPHAWGSSTNLYELSMPSLMKLILFFNYISTGAVSLISIVPEEPISSLIKLYTLTFSFRSLFSILKRSSNLNVGFLFIPLFMNINMKKRLLFLLNERVTIITNSFRTFLYNSK